jgi:hypothetical protein
MGDEAVNLNSGVPRLSRSGLRLRSDVIWRSC